MAATTVSTASIAQVLGSVALLSVAENGALYSVTRAKKGDAASKNKYLVLTMLIYGIAVPYFLYHALDYEGVGMVNLFWNVFSTLSAFFIGWYFFQEGVSNLQKIGVVVSLLGISLIFMGKSMEKKT